MVFKTVSQFEKQNRSLTKGRKEMAQVSLDNVFVGKSGKILGVVAAIFIGYLLLSNYFDGSEDKGKEETEATSEPAPTTSAPAVLPEAEPCTHAPAETTLPPAAPAPVAEPTKQKVFEAKVKQLKVRIDEIGKKAAICKSELDDLKKTFVQLESKVSDLAPFIDLLKTQDRIRGLKKEIEGKNKELINLQGRVKQTQTWIRYNFIGNK